MANTRIERTATPLGSRSARRSDAAARISRARHCRGTAAPTARTRAGRLRSLWLAALLVLGACADPGSGRIAPEPAPDLRDAASRTRRGTMWQLAADAARLDALVSSREGPQAHRAEILALLGRMEQAAERLDASARSGAGSTGADASAPADASRDEERSGGERTAERAEQQARQRAADMVELHGEAFRADLEAARRAVEAEPPRYGPAGAIHDACLRCHDA